MNQYYYNNYQYIPQNNNNVYYINNDIRNSGYYPRPSIVNYVPHQYQIIPVAPIQNLYSPYPTTDRCELFTKNQLSQLRFQINAYKLLAKCLPIPDNLKYSISYTSDSRNYNVDENINYQEEESTSNYETLDQNYIMNKREDLIKTSMRNRLSYLNKLDCKTEKGLDIKSKIEMKSLKLVNLQNMVRGDVLGICKEYSNYDTLLNYKIYRRSKHQTLRDSRFSRRLEKMLKQYEEDKQKVKYSNFITQVLEHSKDFQEFHRMNVFKMSKINKSILHYFSCNEKNKRKEQERIEKERMRRLMAEDEEGYRKLIDEKKNSRLHLLLSQTDEFIADLTQLVRKHKREQNNKKELDEQAINSQIIKRNWMNQCRLISKIVQKRFCLSDLETEKLCNDLFIDNSSRLNNIPKDIRLDVVHIQTNEMLTGEFAPSLSSIGSWFNLNPYWTIFVSEDNHDLLKQIEKSSNNEMLNKSLIVGTSESTDIKMTDDDEYEDNKNQSYYSLAHSVQEVIHEQSSLMINGQMKQYQLQGLEWLVSLYNNHLNGILADEMGLGKTIQTIGLITYLMEKKKVNGPILIIVPLSTISNWALEFDKWAPSVVKILYKGSPNSRKSFQVILKSGKFNVLLTTYEYIIKDKSVLSKISWKYIIIDEGHRMKNHHCKLTQVLNAHYISSYRLLLTGTPLQNKLPELWALLNFLLPNIFNSVNTFEQWFNAPFANCGERVELNQEETLLIIRRLHKVLRPFLLRRLKKEVENQLPDKIEYVIKCEMSALQRTLYYHMQNKGVILTDGSERDKKGTGGSRTLMNTIMQLRKICNHPFMFEHIEQAVAEQNLSLQIKEKKRHNVSHNPIEIYGPDLFRTSGKFELLDRILPKLKETGHRVLIFCQMTNLMSILGIYLEYRNFKYLRLDGSTKSDDRGELLSLFNNPNKDYFIFMLSTRAGGLGLNLQTADTVIIFDSDWNPHSDLQAQDRAHRIGQQNEVRVLRLITNNSVEEKILAAARYKLNVDEKVIQAGMFDQKSTATERRQFLQALLNQDEQEDLQEDEYPDDETLNQMISRSEEEFELFQRMDIDRVYQENKSGTSLATSSSGGNSSAVIYSGKYKSRLMTYDELPSWMIKADKSMQSTKQLITDENPSTSQTELLEDSSIMQPNNAKRIRKEVDYSDSLTESQLVKHFCSDEEEQHLNATSLSKHATIKHYKKSSVLTDCTNTKPVILAVNNIDVNKSQQAPLTSLKQETKKKRKRQSDNDKSDDTFNPDSIKGPEKKKRKIRTPIMLDTIAAEDKRRNKEFMGLITKLLNYKNEDGRLITEAFVRLPTKKELPDYYDIIKQPMDFIRIKQRLRENRYKDLDELNSDIELMCQNAQIYNIDGSCIYEDSKIIWVKWLEFKHDFSKNNIGKIIVKKESRTNVDRKSEVASSSTSKTKAKPGPVIIKNITVPSATINSINNVSTKSSIVGKIPQDNI